MAKKIDTILADALAEAGLISQQALKGFISEAERSGESLQQVLLKGGVFSEESVLNALAKKLKISFVNLNSVSVSKGAIDRVPVKIASYYGFIPLEIKDRALTIAVSSPLDIKIQDEIRTQLGFEIETVLALSAQVSEKLKEHYGIMADTIDRMSAQAPAAAAVSQKASESVEDIEKQAQDASIMKLVNQIILEAWRKRATDIHIEPYRGSVSVRYRIDGLLYDTSLPPEIKNFLNAIISRIKIMSNLNIVERRLPQDGRAIVKVAEQVLDLRISTIPTPFGESVVIRILPTQMLFSLEKLGLPKKDMQLFEQLIQKPHGIIFVTGPTGSGKTTTLYACLSRINTKERKIITIEDPIEYEMSGITQIQVNSEIGLDFARGLRSILRHDPDVIMVGEVRDLETAEIAIRVALTGHLVFSTLHTNDAASGIARLLDIGVEPYLLSSSVEAFIAQRLIRLICRDCKQEDRSVPQELKELIARESGLKSTDGVRIYRGKGCPVCNFTGFFGRSAIYEILLIDEEIKDLIVKKIPSSQIKKVAVSKGMRTLRQDGWQKVISGLTTPEEVMKVTSAGEYPGAQEKPQTSEPALETVNPLSLGNKRVYSRLDARANLTYKVIKSQDDLAKRGFNAKQFSVTKNVSAGGLVFFSDEIISTGSILELKLEFPSEGEGIECLARVVRVEELEEGHNYDIAVCFLDITGAQRGRLNKFVQTGAGERG